MQSFQRGRLMRSGRTQSDHPLAPVTITQDHPGKSGITEFDAHNPFWSSPGIYVESTRSWRSIAAGVVRRTVGTVTWRSDHYRVAVGLTTHEGVAYVDSGSAQAAQFSPGEVSFTPPGVSIRTIFPAVRSIYILQSPETYDAICSELVLGGTIHFETRFPINDPLVSQIVSTITYETEKDFLDHTLVEALNTALAVKMVRHFIGPSKIAPPLSNRLSRGRMQRVRDYIDAHLDDRLTLADLAGVACLSPYHFSRSFKLALGINPQQYLIQRRLERAKTLMLRTNHPLAWVAQEAGFSDQSHLTSVFRRQIGMTPGQFRAANG
jgi:AraC family transcriptional regulator